MRISDWSSDVCSSDLLAGKYWPENSRPSRSVQRSSCTRTVSTMSRSSAALGSNRTRRSPVSRSRSEEHTSELQSLMRNSYAVFCLKKKKHHNNITYTHIHERHNIKSTRNKYKTNMTK